MLNEQLLSATQAMKMLNISRAHFYTKVINDPEFVKSVIPVCLVHNGQKQYRQTEIIDFIGSKQTTVIT